MVVTKRCPRCDRRRPAGCFSKHRSRPGGLAGWCKDCDRDAQAARRAGLSARKVVKIPSRKRCPRCRCTLPAASFYPTILQADGLNCYCKRCSAAASNGTGVRIEALAKRQGWKCSICRSRLTKRTSHVDHCHSTGVVRSVLCNTCNPGLGFFRDDPRLLRRAATYIEKHR